MHKPKHDDTSDQSNGNPHKQGRPNSLPEQFRHQHTHDEEREHCDSDFDKNVPGRHSIVMPLPRRNDFAAVARK